MIRPLEDNLIVEPDPAEEKSSSGIILAKADKEAPDRGVVLAIGPAVIDVHVGDHVIFKRYAGDELKQDGKACVFLKEDDVIAVIEEWPVDAVCGHESGPRSDVSADCQCICHEV